MSTFYRLLRTTGESRGRRNELTHPAYAKPELLASGPRELWSWDITKLKGPSACAFTRCHQKLTFVDELHGNQHPRAEGHLSEYVRRASQGEIIKVTVHGREVAKLVPQGGGEGAGCLAGTPGILWRGGKPEGLARAEVMPKGIRLSDYVAEDRR